MYKYYKISINVWFFLNIIPVEGGGGSFKNSKPIGELGCCKSRIADRTHWWTERWLECRAIYLSICLPVYLSVYLSICLSICLSFYLSVFLAICLSSYLSFYLSAFLSIYLSIYLSFYLSIYLSVYLSVCLSIYLSLCLSINLSICLSFYLSSCKLEDEASLRDFLKFWSWQHWKRSNSARFPQSLNVTTSTTKEFCETSSIFEVDNIKNEAILQDFL